MKFSVAAIVLIFVGSYFLLSNLGLLNISMREIVATWWPVILIALGVSMLFTHKGKN